MFFWFLFLNKVQNCNFFLNVRSAKFHSGQYFASAPTEHNPVIYPSQTSYIEHPSYRYWILPLNVQYFLSLTVHYIRQIRLNEGGWLLRLSK